MNDIEKAIAALKSDNDYRAFEIDKWCKIADPNKREDFVIKGQDVYMFRGMAVKGENALNAIQSHGERIENNNTAIQALQEKQERDKMVCGNCTWLDKEHFFADNGVATSEQTCCTCTFYGDDVPEGVPVEEKHFCSHFETKENENG